jgi:hypothetical protein
MSDDRSRLDESGVPQSFMYDHSQPKMTDAELQTFLTGIFEKSGVNPDQGAASIELADRPMNTAARTNDAIDAWHDYDQSIAPGGLFAKLGPRARAEIEADLIAQHGERPAAPDPHEILRQRVERAHSLGSEVDPGMAAFLDNIIDSVPDHESPARTQQTIRELGMAAHPELVTVGGYGQEVIRGGGEAVIMEAGRRRLAEMQESAVRVLGTPLDQQSDMKARIAVSLHALKYVASVDTAQQRRAAALAKLPARKR